MKTINIENLINGVATFNADPYCIENEEMAEEIMAEVESNGAVIVTDEDERGIALAKLDLPEDSNRIIYQAGDCLFSMDDDENLKPSKKMEATIAKMEEKYGKLNRDYFVETIETNRVGRGFYDGCTLTCDTIKSLNIVVAHDGSYYKF